MKVLMQSRVNLFESPGGDTIQLLKTKEYLEKIGIKVDVSLELDGDLSDYDIIHLFNLTRVQETFIQIKNAKSQNKPIVFSTIYWPSTEFEKIGQKGLRRLLGHILSIDQIESLKAFYKYYFRNEKNSGTKFLINNSFSKMQNEILKLSNWFLPNSVEEMNKIEEYMNFKTNKYTVVPNAIDGNKVNIALRGGVDSEFAKFKDYILCVGRIETRKNQQNLIKALQGTKYKVLFVGKVSPGHKKYGEKVLRSIRENDNFEYIESIPNDKLYNLYKICKVHVLISWFETPGLVSIEAASMGCNIVVSDRGTTKDYFKDYAFFCSPKNLNQIRSAIDQAYNSPYNTDFRDYILENYSWEKAAEKTLEGYNKVLENLK